MKVRWVSGSYNPDPGLHTYLNKIDPGQPTDINIYEAPADILAKIPSTPGSLAEALEALEKDHNYLISQKKKWL